MVYCSYKERTDNTVVYNYGGEPEDMTGLIGFDTNGSGFTVLKEPEKSTVYVRHLHRLYGKYKADFSNQEFKKKISFEA